MLATDLRDVNLEDLLGRHPISLDTTVTAEQRIDVLRSGTLSLRNRRPESV